MNFVCEFHDMKGEHIEIDADVVQVGSNNVMKTNITEDATGAISFSQWGTNNNIYVKLVDNRRKTKIELAGKEMRLRLQVRGDRKDDIEKKMLNANIDELNSYLSKLNVSIKNIEPGCLIIDVESRVPFDSNARKQIIAILDLIFSHSNVYEFLKENNVEELHTFCYFYHTDICFTPLDDVIVQPVNHMSLELTESTACDVDLYVSKTCLELADNHFTTEVHEKINLTLCAETVQPDNSQFPEVQNILTERQVRRFNDDLKTCELIVDHIETCSFGIEISLSTKYEVPYSDLVLASGPIPEILGTILREIFQTDKVSSIQLLRLCVIMFVPLDYDKEDKGVDFFLETGSQISEAIENKTFSTIVSTLLGTQDGRLPENVQNLKVRAVLDYANVIISDQSDEDSDQAIDISECLETDPEEAETEQLLNRIKESRQELEEGRLHKAKELAQDVFKELTEIDSKDTIMFKDLLKIFEGCADNFYALKCFWRIRILTDIEDEFDVLDHLLQSGQYWVRVVEGPYEFEEIIEVFLEMENMAHQSLKDDNFAAFQLWCELGISYSHLESLYRLTEQRKKIQERQRVGSLCIIEIFYREEEYDIICSMCRKLEKNQFLNAEGLYLWAQALHQLGKVDVALKKVEAALNIENMEEQTRKNLKMLQCELLMALDSSLKRESDLDMDWLEDTNIRKPKQMQEKATKIRKRHVPKKRESRPKRQEQKVVSPQSTGKCNKEEERPKVGFYEDSSKYKSWKDVPPHNPEPKERTKRRRQKRHSETSQDFNVVECANTEFAENDSGQESDDETMLSENLITLTDPNYQHPDKEDTLNVQSTCYETLSKFEDDQTNTELVENGLDLSDKCIETFKHSRAKFCYPPEEDIKTLKENLQTDSHTYKKCVIQVESAHKAVCKNMDLADDLKEIFISGRSKCGRIFSEDEVVVEVLGQSQSKKANEDSKFIKDTNVYGKVLGILKRNRYRNIPHPVLVCAKDDFLPHMMKPLCKTVPKIQICHTHCNNKHKLDLYVFDRKSKSVQHRETIEIDHDVQRAYCYLVAILHWEDMYPFGVILRMINIKDEVQSGIDILRLQHRVPGSFSTETTDEAKNIRKLIQSDHENICNIFTVCDNDIGEFGFSLARKDSATIEIGVHVPDVASMIKPGGCIDIEARKRCTDYETGRNFDITYMLPYDLRKKVGFVLEEERRAFSLYFSFANHGQDPEVINQTAKVTRTVVKTVRQMSMFEANEMTGLSATVDDLRILRLASETLRKKRLGNAAFYENISEYRLFDEMCTHSDIQRTIFEILLYADLKVAEYLTERYPDHVPLRCQSKPLKDAVVQWKSDNESRIDGTLLSLQGVEMIDEEYSVLVKHRKNEHLIPVQISVVEKIQNCTKDVGLDEVKKILGADEIHPLQCLALRNWTSIQGNAEFKCSSNNKEDPCHFGLRVSSYTPFTKPLSNYLGIFVQRLLHAIEDCVPACPFEKIEIEKLCMEMTDKKRQAKQFNINCQLVIFGHKFRKQPTVLNGFLQKITESDIELCFPAMTPLHKLSKSLPLNLLHSRDRPVLHQGAVTMKWQGRIYSQRFKTKTSPKENEYLKLDPNKSVAYQSLAKWTKLLRSLVKGKDEKLGQLSNALDSNTTRTSDTVNDVCSEVITGNFAKQTCTYSLSFKYGQVLKIQMSAAPERGLMIPIPQLYDITPNVKFCLQHVRNPVEVFSGTAKNHSKNEYGSCKNYIDVWLPILSMEIAMQCTRNNSVTLCDLPITFKEHGGIFTLKYSYLEKRDIEFAAHPVDLLPSTQEHEHFLSGGLDFLCIRCPLDSSPTASNFGNGAICSKQSYWIGHARVANIQHRPFDKDIVRIQFICHRSSPKIPEEMRNKRKQCQIEILQVFDVNRRTEVCIKMLETAPCLAQAIAQRKKIPHLDPDYLELVESQKIELNEFKIQYNDDQQHAVQKALRSSFSLIQGPPGTGKTFTGVTLIKLFCSVNERVQDKRYVVFCGPSNKSVDLVTEYLMKMYGSSLRILRMYGSALECAEFPIPGKVFSPQQTNYVPNQSIQNVTLHHIIRRPGKPYAERLKEFDRKFKDKKAIDYGAIKMYKTCIANAIQEELPNYEVILCTTAVATSARLLSVTKNCIFQLLIDEAGMCTEPESLAAIIATKAKQVVLIGDHQQLRPVVLCQEAAELGLQKSLFERYAESTESVLTLLRQQYRMHPSLCRFPSRMFYKDKLETIASSKWQVLEPLQMWNNPENPCVFCHVEGEEEYLSYSTDEGNEMSRYNMAEVHQVVKVFKHMVKTERVDSANIIIMSQYNAQCSRIRLALRKERLFVQNVNTVVASQGGEWDYVIFSLVRSLPEYRIEPKPTHGWCIENLGFITDYHQVNVALTRARKGLILIGNEKLMECDEVFDSLLGDYRKYGCVVKADSFPPKGRRKGHKK
ncbi:helicase with zinc finger domain 2-like isoform X4 [Ostrea edulis]|uniref:helicase with zinc finger domain 2-like isoform X4 n=1 Tax=Ostrea edulis TaxID=37623 RepID=UPI0024AFDB95|nr:helicase with zinc finger domain 2-like isoform X4 [Ostrea edulis]XP_056009194.1 helicase with zinc finger domain 2-like isoform X4 [Ostrea edulis]XP_056009195.1 helicase with zinc finger domain 2-like isoform X4 [Ostrea edulis]